MVLNLLICVLILFLSQGRLDFDVGIHECLVIFISAIILQGHLNTSVVSELT